MNTRDEFDPEAYDQDRDARRLLGSFRAMMSLGGNQLAPDRGPLSPDESAYDPTLYQDGPAGLVGRLQALQEAQGGYQSRQPAMDPRRYELAQAITNASRNLGIDPSDLATAISYETGGTFNHNLWGGKDGNYFGLIQFGPNERARYGVKEGQSVSDQMGAVERYLRDRGLKPGMGLLDVYSTINAGRPGLYDRSDAGHGGAPGTVADKVNTQMGGHVTKAATLLKQYDAARPRYAVPPAFPQHADPIFPGVPAKPPAFSPAGKRAGDPSLPVFPGAEADFANRENPAVSPLPGLVSGTPMQYWPISLFDTRR